MLFSTVIDPIPKSMDLSGNIFTRLKQCVAYADNILITSRTEQSMVETFLQLKEQSEQLGLIINLHKTKYIKYKKGKKDSDSGYRDSCREHFRDMKKKKKRKNK
jgi:hypothetical protein